MLTNASRNGFSFHGSDLGLCFHLTVKVTYASSRANMYVSVPSKLRMDNGKFGVLTTKFDCTSQDT